MLAVSATLYYATYSFPDRYDMEPRFTASRPNSSRPIPPIAADQDVVRRKIWDILNPPDDPLLFIKIQPPTIAELPPPPPISTIVGASILMKTNGPSARLSLVHTFLPVTS